MKENNYKKSNKFILFSFVLTLCIVFIINFVVDPFCIFGKKYYFFNKQRAELKRQERLTKIIRLEKDKYYSAVLAGTSRADNSIPDDYYYKLSGKKLANIALWAANFSEMKYMIDKAIETQPKLSTIIIAVDPDHMYNLQEKDISRITSLNTSTLTKYFTVLFSYHATESSILTIIKSFNKKYVKGYLPSEVKRTFYNKNIRTSFKETIKVYSVSTKYKEDKPNLALLEEYVKNLEEKGYEVIIYTHPVHTTMFELLKQNGSWEKINYFKKDLAKIKPFYDFYYPSDYTNEKISPDMKYFFENSHCTYLLGEKVLDKIILNKGDYGHLVNTENVDYYNKMNTEALKKWERDNPSEVDFVKNTLMEGR